MADFYQTGLISTLHRLKRFDQQRMEDELLDHSRLNKVALVLPALYSELEGPALGPIVETLKEIHYLNEIIIVLDRASTDQYVHAKKYFSRLPQEHHILWINGPRMESLKSTLEENGLTLGPPGKGLSCWFAYGFILARGKSRVIALHDCDILTYSRELLARLCYPTVNPNLDYRFTKGFYSRVTSKMNGRATRLLITPLIRAMQAVVGTHPLLVYFDSFRYALAGEFSMEADLARLNRIPSDWGLEVGVLAEVYRNCGIKRIAQVEICENYDHKHQPLSPQDPSQGLFKMGIDISAVLFRIMAAEGIELSSGKLKTLLVRYVRTAEDTVSRYYADAKINGLEFDRHDEENAVQTFAEAVRIASERFLEDPLGAPLIPNWNRVSAALPDFFDKLLQCVEQDEKETTINAESSTQI